MVKIPVKPIGELNPNEDFLNSREWTIIEIPRLRTLQYFITSRCNQRCDGCFFENQIGEEEVSLAEYKIAVGKRVKEDGIQKVNLLGGEPTLHPDLEAMVRFNHELGLKTHIYTNGARLDRIPINPDVIARLSILSYDGKEKPITRIATSRPLTIVFAVNEYNIRDIEKVMKYCDDKLNVSQFLFSTWNHYDNVADFYSTSSREIPLKQYLEAINKTLREYDGKIRRIQMGHCGFLDLPFTEPTCSFTNRMPSGLECSCPLDIPLQKFSEHAIYSGNCLYSDNCMIQSIGFEKD